MRVFQSDVFFESINKCWSRLLAMAELRCTEHGQASTKQLRAHDEQNEQHWSHVPLRHQKRMRMFLR